MQGQPRDIKKYVFRMCFVFVFQIAAIIELKRSFDVLGRCLVYFFRSHGLAGVVCGELDSQSGGLFTILGSWLICADVCSSVQGSHIADHKVHCSCILDSGAPAF